MKTVARAVAAAVATLTLAGATAWGCAAETNPPGPQHPTRSEPDGGWQNYRPEARRTDVDPTPSASGPVVPFMPTTAPVDPAMGNLY